MARFLAALCALMPLLSGCSLFDARTAQDPFTGGVNASTSALLDVPVPAGMQTYPSHGSISSPAPGVKQGLETLRGYVNQRDAAAALFNTLKNAGWQLKMHFRKGERSFYLYQKGGEHAALAFRPQGALVILEIWRGQELPPGTEPDFAAGSPTEEDGHASIAPEEYGAIGQDAPGGAEERWGGKIEEREL